MEEIYTGRETCILVDSLSNELNDRGTEASWISGGGGGAAAVWDCWKRGNKHAFLGNSRCTRLLPEMGKQP